MNPDERFHIRRLTPHDAPAFQALRLSALVQEPTAFGSSYEEEENLTPESVAARLAVHADNGVFGAFDGDTLCGMVVLRREGMRKLRHKGMIFGMYVAPEARGRGVGRDLLLQALALARSVTRLRQVNLGVNAGNAAAIALYESLGFEIFGRESGALKVGEDLYDELHMCWRIR
ncbi:N-acetyltransferase family protein [Variovorax sp. RCC_210]|uniref:GNAT family N-acetyltransferase n=1 Tax=Variovorax sp. RCC_210 TaxID=3239217 RepID=UPI00352502D3